MARYFHEEAEIYRKLVWETPTNLKIEANSDQTHRYSNLCILQRRLLQKLVILIISNNRNADKCAVL